MINLGLKKKHDMIGHSSAIQMDIPHFLPQKSMFKGHHLPPPTHQPTNPQGTRTHQFHLENRGTTRAAKHTQRMAARTNLELCEAQSSCKRAFLGAWRWRLVGWWTKPPALPAGTCCEWMSPLFFGGFNPLQKQGLLLQSKQGSHLGSRYHPGNTWFIDWWSSRERSHLRTLRLINSQAPFDNIPIYDSRIISS